MTANGMPAFLPMAGEGGTRPGSCELGKRPAPNRQKGRLFQGPALRCSAHVDTNVCRVLGFEIAWACRMATMRKTSAEG